MSFPRPIHRAAVPAVAPQREVSRSWFTGRSQVWSWYLELKALLGSGSWDKGWGQPRMMIIHDVSLRWRWAHILEAADGSVSAVKTLPSSGLGGAACRGSAALPEEAGTWQRRVPPWEGREEGLDGRNLDCEWEECGVCRLLSSVFCPFLGKK